MTHLLLQLLLLLKSLPICNIIPFSGYSKMAMSLAAGVSQGGIGSATVVNHCPRPVYYHVSGFKNGKGWDSETKMIPSEGFHIQYDTVVSVKLFHNPTELQGSISQFEFNLDETVGRIWYDISNVDAFRTGAPPFMEGGMQLTIGEKNAQYPTCIPVHCPKGERICKDAYNLPDDPKTLACPQSTSLHLVLCPDGEFPPPVGRSGDSGRPGEGGRPGMRPSFPIGRSARALDAGNDEKLSKRNETVEVGGLTWELGGGSSKSHVAKLPVLGLVAGLACYFIAML
jgi:hypothetical protein